METEHSPTPWTSIGSYIDDSNGFAVADTFRTSGSAMRHTNASRIVACVNACEGVSNERLVAMRVADLVAQRDELLDALREMVAIAELTVGWMPQQPNADGPLIKARAAIVKAEGVRS